MVMAACPFSDELLKRSEFSIPLIQMSLGEDSSEPNFKRIRVYVKSTDEYAIITRYADTYVKNTRSGTEKTHFQENPDQAFSISNFEAVHLSRALMSLVSTLDIFEKDLGRNRWDRCLYLDSFLPRFLMRFYHLVCAARNSVDALPGFSAIPDAEYDVSLNSPLSDRRITTWQKRKEHIIKLRIISRELSYQLLKWDEKELSARKRDVYTAYSSKAEEAYGLFVRLYFNLLPSPDTPVEGEHL
jgi:hypothetical protein